MDDLFNLEEINGFNFEMDQFKKNDDETMDIAIIGMSGRFGQASDLNEYWEVLQNGKDIIRDFPHNRAEDCKPYIEYMKSIGFPDSALEFIPAGYLEEIDMFDYKLFSISRKEANLMDPNMRIFLEECINTIYDAGYAGNRIKGSNTGVFVGFSSDFGEEYKRMIQVLEQELIGLSVTGNIKSVIAGRVAYLLDLHGPAICVDTACSSSLTALYSACNALRNKDCNMALVGSVKLNVVPVIGTKDSVIGIQSNDNKARTFDNGATGTGLGEGAAVVLLKPLVNAKADRDNIYAVIKGIAVNQDGNTMGLTAPNCKAQEDVICKAWENAGIIPNDITYMEAHGTATKLGDTVEISAIENAFRRYTNRRQFCGIGSVKTNIGHTDHLAGMASLIKVVLALKNGVIPKSLHFERPNNNVPFDESPVYIVDKQKKLEKKDSKIRCGVSAFGLSGTNVHAIIEEYKRENLKKTMEAEQIFVVSGNTNNSLKRLIHQLLIFIKKENHLPIGDICWTLATGRVHYYHRIAFIIRNVKDLINKLELIEQLDNEKLEKLEDIYYSSDDIIYYERTANCITKREEELRKVAKQYIHGEDVEWESIFRSFDVDKASLPGIVFDKERCWIHPNRKIRNISKHALVAECIVRTIDCDVYKIEFNVNDFWVLNEHRVNGLYVLPGTTYLEIITKCIKEYVKDGDIEYSEVLFISPFSLKKGKTGEIYINVYKYHLDYKVIISSYNELTKHWNRHCEGTVIIKTKGVPELINIDNLKKHLNDERNINYDDINERPIETGKRWNNIKKVYVSKDKEQVLAYMSIEAYKDEVEQYYLHPAFMDNAVNIAIQELNDNMYLPLSYKKIRVYDCLPVNIYSYICKKTSDSDDVILFDVTLTDTKGKILVSIENYAIKKVRKNNILRTDRGNSLTYETVTWIEKEIENKKNIELTGKKTLVLSIKDSDLKNRFGIDCLKEIIIKDIGYTDRIDEFRSILETELPERIVFYINTNDYRKINTMKSFDKNLDMTLYTLYDLAKAIVEFKKKVELIIITKHANKVNDIDCKKIQPLLTAVIGLLKVMEKENINLTCRVIDRDDETNEKLIEYEILCQKSVFNVAYRFGKRYVELLKNIDLNESGINADYIKPGGVYLITGGSGSLGIAVAKMIAEKKKVNLLLVGRMPITIDAEDNDCRVDKLLHEMKNIRDLGSTVEYYSLDIGDENQINNMLEKLTVKIDGVIHAAGVAGGGLLAFKDKRNFKEVINPKIKGTWLIDRLIGKQNPDFLIMFSSVSSVIGETGQGDYVAANGYLNSFSLRNNNFKKSIAILWPAWKEIGMAVNHGSINDRKSLFQSLDTKTALEALNTIVNNNITNVIPANLSEKVLSDVSSNMNIVIDSEILKHCEHTKNDYHATVDLNMNQEDVLENLMRIWSEVLEIDDLNPDDNFYKLGGDSIIATYLLKKLNEQYSDIFDITDIFSYPSVNEMCNYIKSKRKGKSTDKKVVFELESDSDDDEMDEILYRLANNELSIEEVKKYI